MSSLLGGVFCVCCAAMNDVKVFLLFVRLFFCIPVTEDRLEVFPVCHALRFRAVVSCCFSRNRRQHVSVILVEQRVEKLKA